MMNTQAELQAEMAALTEQMRTNNEQANKIRMEARDLYLPAKCGDRGAAKRLVKLEEELTQYSRAGFDLNQKYLLAARRLGEMRPPKVSGGGVWWF